MKCGRCGANVLLGSAQCSKCGASMLDGSMPDVVVAKAAPPAPEQPAQPARTERAERADRDHGTGAPPPPPPPPPSKGDAAAARPPRPPIKAQKGPKATPPGQAAKASIGCAGCLVPLVVVVAVGAGIVFASGSFDDIGDVFERGERVAAPAVVLDVPIEFELSSDDTGVHPLVATATGPYVVTVTGIGDFDPTVRVLESGTELGFDDDGGDGHDSRLRVDLVEGGQYDVEVEEFSGDAGDYVLAVAPTVVEGQPVGRAGQIDGVVQANQAVRHPFTGPGGEVTVTVLGRDGFDPYLTIRDGGGTELGTNDDTDGRDSRLTLSLPLEASIVIEVKGYNDAGGAYTVVVD